ncbi:hypothetical protein [Ligilactobacillus acidipiscis]|uniref:hypothetical protein n=1 Tax=Ligilactobacillus acidipiscis TaxID=89059 RepID=UPI0023F7B31F|nr:hypothetical protein [Ligilactobacillus acidipiscis]WEV58168.1 hypothetical protein OZX66_12605 [Ligilactobacillus acidipiscis]
MSNNYLLKRAHLYQDEAQMGIEAEMQENTEKASLILKALERTTGAELATVPVNAISYTRFLITLNEFLQEEGQVFVKLEFIRDNSREYIRKMQA